MSIFNEKVAIVARESNFTEPWRSRNSRFVEDVDRKHKITITSNCLISWEQQKLRNRTSCTNAQLFGSTIDWSTQLDRIKLTWDDSCAEWCFSRLFLRLTDVPNKRQFEYSRIWKHSDLLELASSKIMQDSSCRNRYPLNPLIASSPRLSVYHVNQSETPPDTAI